MPACTRARDNAEQMTARLDDLAGSCGRDLRAEARSERTAVVYDRYLRERRTHKHAYSPALLLSQRRPLSPDGVRDLLRRIGEAAGVEDLHPHRFRHTFAPDFLLAGGQGPDLKRLAGCRRTSCSSGTARAVPTFERARPSSG